MPVAGRSIMPNLKNISEIIRFLGIETLPSIYSSSVMPIGRPTGDIILENKKFDFKFGYPYHNFKGAQ